MPIQLFSGDITQLAVDAIVNAANNSLLGGGGVDGAIHRAAGRGLLAECAQLQGCATGDAKLTGGHALPARYVIHTVGPIWRGGTANEPQLLASCYRCVLDIAGQHALRSLAFPAISCGVYGFPLQQAAEIAVREVRAGLAQNPLLDTVIFCCLGPDVYRAYELALQQ